MSDSRLRTLLSSYQNAASFSRLAAETQKRLQTVSDISSREARVGNYDRHLQGNEVGRVAREVLDLTGPRMTGPELAEAKAILEFAARG